jgi:hypothetical protein
MDTRIDLTVSDFLAAHAEPLQALVLRLRALILETLGEPEERVNAGWGGLGYHAEDAGYVCGIFPKGDRVRLLFEHGRLLPDPDALFTGGGKQTRHVDFWPGDELPEKQILAMLERALVYGVMRRTGQALPRGSNHHRTM